jgi:hypothetical protein
VVLSIIFLEGKHTNRYGVEKTVDDTHKILINAINK